MDTYYCITTAHEFLQNGMETDRQAWQITEVFETIGLELGIPL